MIITGNMQMGVNGVAMIIQRREGIDFVDALQMVTDCQSAMKKALANGGDPEEILAFELGLEPDYLFDLL